MLEEGGVVGGRNELFEEGTSCLRNEGDIVGGGKVYFLRVINAGHNIGC